MDASRTCRHAALPLAHQQLDEVCDVAAGEGDVLDARPDDVPAQQTRTQEGMPPKSEDDARPLTDPSETGITCVTPSPASTTVPVSVRATTCFDVHDAASASTA